MSAIIYCKILSEHHLEVHAPGIRFARQEERLPVETLRGFIYLPAFLDTGLPRGNVRERYSGPMRGAILTQSHNPLRLATPPGSTTPTLFE